MCRAKITRKHKIMIDTRWISLWHLWTSNSPVLILAEKLYTRQFPLYKDGFVKNKCSPISNDNDGFGSLYAVGIVNILPCAQDDRNSMLSRAVKTSTIRCAVQCYYLVIVVFENCRLPPVNSTGGTSVPVEDFSMLSLSFIWMLIRTFFHSNDNDYLNPVSK